MTDSTPAPVSPATELFGFDAGRLKDPDDKVFVFETATTAERERALVDAVFAKDTALVRRLIDTGMSLDIQRKDDRHEMAGLLLLAIISFHAPIITMVAAALPAEAVRKSLRDLPREALRHVANGACAWLMSFSDGLTDPRDVAEHAIGVIDCLDDLRDEPGVAPDDILALAERCVDRIGLDGGAGRLAFNLATVLLGYSDERAADFFERADGQGFHVYAREMADQLSDRIGSLTTVRLSRLARFVDSPAGVMMGAAGVMKEALKTADSHPTRLVMSRANERAASLQKVMPSLSGFSTAKQNLLFYQQV